MLAAVTRIAIRTLDWLAGHLLEVKGGPAHQRTGRQGEEDAYFHLRKLGYVMVARNYRSPHRRGELDLVGWEGDVLCFIEVKTRSTRDIKPAEAAVDQEKRKELLAMAGEYLHHFRGIPKWRIDIVSVYYDSNPPQPVFELFRNAVPAPSV